MTYLDLFDGVHDKHVLQVLHGSLHPVVKWSRSLRKLKEQLVYGIQQLLCPLRITRDKAVKKPPKQTPFRKWSPSGAVLGVVYT